MNTKELIINPEWEHAQFVSIAELKECEQKLEAANERIKRLEEAGDDLYANCDPSRWDSAATAARKLSEQNAWRKAKEAKP